MQCGRLRSESQCCHPRAFGFVRMVGYIPASPAVRMEAMLAKKKPIYPRC